MLTVESTYCILASIPGDLDACLGLRITVLKLFNFQLHLCSILWLLLKLLLFIHLFIEFPLFATFFRLFLLKYDLYTKQHSVQIPSVI